MPAPLYVDCEARKILQLSEGRRRLQGRKKNHTTVTKEHFVTSNKREFFAETVRIILSHSREIQKFIEKLPLF